MGLREDNPLIDSDLELIITAFEKGVIHSQDIDSVFVPFRRELAALENYPKSIIKSINNLPVSTNTQEDNGTSENIPALSDVETNTANTENPTEEINEDDVAQKMKEWVTDCVPCSGDFKRTISSMNAEFFKDIGVEWDKTLEEVWNKLKDLDGLLEDVDVSAAFCDLGKILMSNCAPDIKKMLFILSSMLTRMETEISVDSGIIDSYLMSALSPIFSELAANLDLIDTLALDPIRCVLDNIKYQINNGPRIAQQAKGAYIDPVQRYAAEQRSRINQALYRNRLQQAAAGESEQTVGEVRRSEAERRAEAARLQQRRQDLDQEVNSRMQSALARANQSFNQINSSLNFLDRFQEYLKQGTDFLAAKKDWLLRLIEEFINSGLDRWNQHMIFAKSKTDLLTLISVLKAIIDAAKNGDISCGSESNQMSEEDVARIIGYWEHPSESLEITVEDDTIVTRRRPDRPAQGSNEDRGVITGSSGDSSRSDVNNIVVRRSISSCLKKVTSDEADQVQLWISQLEQEV